MNYDISPHISGDTWSGISSLTLTQNNSALNLTNAKVVFQVKKAYEVAAPVVLELTTQNNSIIISNAASGIITIPEQLINIPVGKYQYYIVAYLSTSAVYTPVVGNWTIIPRIPLDINQNIYDHYPIIE